MTFKVSNLIDVVAQLLSSVVGRGCYLVLQVILARTLGPRGFGLYAIGWTVTGLVSTLAPLGMPQAVVRYGITGRRAIFSAPAIIAVLVGLICLSCLYMGSDAIAQLLFAEPDAAPVIRALAPSIPLLSLFGVLAGGLRASGAGLASGVVGAVLFVLYLCMAMLCFFFAAGRSPAAAAYLYSVALAVTLVPTIGLLLRQSPDSNALRLRPLLNFGLVTMFIHSASVINLWVDRLIVGLMMDVRAIGVYQVASQLAMVALVIRVAVVSVFEARIPKDVEIVQLKAGLTVEFIAATRLLLHVSVPGLLCLALMAKFWVGSLFGLSYFGAAAPLAALVIGQLCQTFTGPSTTALHMTGDEHMVMRVTFASCLLNVIGNVALIPWFGSIGSAAASGLANITLGAACLWRLRRSGRLQLPLAALIDIMLGTAISAVTIALLVQELGTPSFFIVGAILVAGYLSYAITILLSCQVEDEALDLIRALLRRVTGDRRQRTP